MEEPARASPVVAVSSIILSMALVAMSSGVMFGYIPVKLAAEAFPPWVAATMITAVAAGGVIGCLATSALVKHSGHARAFMALVALEALSFIAIAAGPYPIIWIVARIVYGSAVTGLFIVAQSWLNDATENQWRGRVIALFYMGYVLSLGFGSFSLRFAPLEGPMIPLMAVVMILLSIFPIALTRLPPPGPPTSGAVAFRAVWQISPVGLVGMFCVGGLTMLIQGFAPIYATASGYGKDHVGLMMFMMQFGMLAIQLPLGIWSDRTDRRIVLIASAVLVTLATALLGIFTPTEFLIMVAMFGLCAGAVESIYALSNAHANDRADPQYYVSLSSTLLIGWSISAFIIPGIATILTPVGGPTTFIWMASLLALTYAVFVLARLRANPAVPAEESDAYVPMAGHVPAGIEFVSGETTAETVQVIPDAKRLEDLNDQAEILMGMVKWPVHQAGDQAEKADHKIPQTRKEQQNDL